MSNTPDNLNYLSPEGFELTFVRIPGVTFFCQQITTPDITIGTTPVPNPSTKEVFFPGTAITFGDIVLSFIVDEDLSNYNEIFTWIKESIITADRSSVFSDGTLVILNNSKSANVKMTFQNCFPYNLGPIVFDTTMGPDLPIKADCTLKFTDFNIISIT